ncbi:lipid A deacylase LpxR family protein [Sediminibacterium ginsengisoli]|uniref:Lipid A deacylase LpxR family protein n=1 Tax=Sediminibacterium ginsengisoli TaxID=413434 RepID=A0A1T4MBK8_9BACT|nr:lipid A deacylase LpxR family protein [Sediminibacterium ginsengisoli]SJZ64227.1 hypothetical protein SAMN04488132_103293 [Sediminibacterium ginsengisoli]
MKYLLVFCCCIHISVAFAQKKKNVFFNKELSFVNDNDAYLLQYKDAYYTNGLFFRYAAASGTEDKKKIRALELGQMIYTPLERNTLAEVDIDRPYSGYLYLKYLQTTFRPKEDAILQWSAAAGMIGESSLGEEVQNGYHQLFRYSRFKGWRYQVRNDIALDGSVLYARTLPLRSDWFKMVPAAQGNIGTTFLNARLGTYLCVGAFERNDRSALFASRIGKNTASLQRKAELFFYTYPHLVLQGYNATIQGGLLHKGTGAVLGDIRTLMFEQNTGVCYAQGRWTLRLEYVYQTREARLQQTDQQYGSIQFAYRFQSRPAL